MALTCKVEDGRHDGLPDLPRPLGAAVGIQEHQQLARPVAALPDGRVQRRCPVTHRLGRLRTTSGSLILVAGHVRLQRDGNRTRVKMSTAD